MFTIHRKIMNPEKQRKLQEYTRAIAEILYTEAESEQQFTQWNQQSNKLVVGSKFLGPME
jgi:hypothetical protein